MSTANVELSDSDCAVDVLLTNTGLVVVLGISVLDCMVDAKLLGALGHICSGPTPARNATTRFSPWTPWLPQALCIVGTNAKSALMQEVLQERDEKSLLEQPEIGDVYTALHPCGRFEARGAISESDTALMRVGSAKSAMF